MRRSFAQWCRSSWCWSSTCDVCIEYFWVPRIKQTKKTYKTKRKTLYGQTFVSRHSIRQQITMLRLPHHRSFGHNVCTIFFLNHTVSNWCRVCTVIWSNKQSFSPNKKPNNKNTSFRIYSFGPNVYERRRVCFVVCLDMCFNHTLLRDFYETPTNDQQKKTQWNHSPHSRNALRRQLVITIILCFLSTRCGDQEIITIVYDFIAGSFVECIWFR